MGKSKELAELGDVVTQSGGNVLVGTTTNPDNRKFRVYGPTEFDGTGVSLITHKSSGTEIGSAGQGNYVVSGGPADGYGITSATSLVFGSGGYTERMRIDASGRVTMPYQPIFYARNHETANGWVSGTELYGFYDTLVNIGGHMNISTGRFTAPVAGTYYLEFSAQEEAYYGHWGDGIFFRIRVNGVDKILCGNDTGVSDLGGEMFISFGGYVYMNAGDYASIYGDVGGSVISLERYVGGFGGHLVG